MTGHKVGRSKLLVVTSALIISACPQLGGFPVIGVSVERQDLAYAFVFRNCANEKPIGIYSPRLFEERDGKKVQLCSLRYSDRSEPALETGGSWQYGTVPKGYELVGDCPTLTHGPRYFVSAGPLHAFSLAPDGSIAHQDPVCP